MWKVKKSLSNDILPADQNAAALLEVCLNHTQQTLQMNNGNKQKSLLSWKKYSSYAIDDCDGSITEEILNGTDRYTDEYEEYLDFLSKKTSWYKNKTNVSDHIIAFLDRCKAANLSVEELRSLFQDEIFIHVIDGIISAGCGENCFYTYWGPCLYLRHKLSKVTLGNYPLLGSGTEEELRISPEVFDTFFADCYNNIYISSWKLSLLEEILVERQVR